MAQYHVDEYPISIEVFGHIILQWTSVLSVGYLWSTNQKLHLLTKTWMFYLLSQICVCTTAYMRLQWAPYVPFLQEQVIWYSWRFFVSLLAMALISISVLFMYSLNPDNKDKIIRYFKYILPLYGLCIFVILYGLCIFVPPLRDLFLFTHLSIAVIMELVTYTTFVKRVNKINDKDDNDDSVKIIKKVNNRNIYLTIVNALSFMLFNALYVVDGNGYIAVFQRMIGSLWYAYNTYAFVQLEQMKYFNDNERTEDI
eukprot:403692_1